MNIFLLIVSAFIIMLASLIGVLTIYKRLGLIIEKNLHFLVSFSAGVFLFITYHLATETIEHNSLLAGLGYMAIGALIVWAIFKISPFFHHHHDHHEGDSHTHSSLDARKILFSDALHNAGDGILLATSFAVSNALGITAAISIFIHELIQETSKFFVLKEAGYSTKKALTANFLVSGTILISAVLSTVLLNHFTAIEDVLAGIAAGSFLIVVLKDLVPHSIRLATKSHLLKHLVWFLVGLVIMFIIGLINPEH